MRLLIFVIGIPYLFRADRLGIMKGTLWCGAGNIATNKNQLGIFQGPDYCCRQHDHCPFKLEGFESKFGLSNWRPWVSVHCDCEEQFQNCLRLEGSEKSRLVGQLYFSYFNSRCFTLKPGQICSEKTWWGRCIKHTESLIGKWHTSPKFEY